MAEQGILPLAPRDGSGLPQFQQSLQGITGHPYEASPRRAILSTAWEWNTRAGIWERCLSRELYAIVSEQLTAPEWVANVRVYGGRGRNRIDLANGRGFPTAEAAKAWVDEWVHQAAGTQGVWLESGRQVEKGEAA